MTREMLPSSSMENLRVLHKDDLVALMRDAAEAGAKKALVDLGLHDEQAPHDVKELRDLLSALKSARSIVAKAVLQWVTVGLLGALSLGLYLKILGKNP